MFVALSSSNNSTTYNLLTSSDGATWSLSTGALPVLNYTNIAYGSGLFVTFPNGSNNYYTSTNGTTWTPQTGNGYINSSWIGLAFGNGTFVAVAEIANTILRSTDGINWSSTTVTHQRWKNLVFVNNRFIATGVVSGTVNTPSTFGIITSSDGSTWSAPSSVFSASIGSWWSSTAWNNSNNLILTSSINNVPRIIRSTDGGTSWTAQTTTGIDTTGVNQLYGIAFGNNKFIAVNPDNKPIISSTDGINWSNINGAPTNEKWFKIAYGNGRWVILGITTTTSTNPLILTSTVL